MFFLRPRNAIVYTTIALGAHGPRGRGADHAGSRVRPSGGTLGGRRRDIKIWHLRRTGVAHVAQGQSADLREANM